MPIQCLKAFLLLILLPMALCNAEFEFATAPPVREQKTVEPPVVEEKADAPKEPAVKKQVVKKEKVEGVEETTLPEPQVEPEVKKDPHIKIVIHTTNNCPYCEETKKEAEKLVEYEVDVVHHDGAFRTDYGYYINNFPYIEFYYDGKCVKYSPGKLTERQYRNIINSIK